MRRVLLLLTGLFVIAIGAVLLIAPQTYLSLYVVAYDPGMDFAARRFAPAVLGLGVLLCLARSLPDGQFLTSLCAICGLAFLGVAVTGGHAWLSGQAKDTILVAAAIECVIAVLFLATAAKGARA
ncbi:hypothetical protein MWU54_02530 [Marivita sp. S6314]|uniref:hypothetical protein n=1 Tax=Marivita sp. S6314 TaxID=2926406 RepID=UPI001FF2C2D2|nr:hypothetical protein [Marivita sp. S6314]MCK0148886.1 hypothetical protein [Marivita sp. S6314]